MFSIQQLLPYTSAGPVEFFVDSLQASIADYKRNSNVVEIKTLPFSLFPLEDFYSLKGKAFYRPRDETRLNVTPMHFAAIRGDHDVVAFLLMLSKSHSVNDEHQEASALSLALYSEKFHVAKLLLEGGAQAGCGLLINGLHAAARRGLKNEIEFFVKHDGIDADVQDKDGATPVVHALRLPENEARETIRLLFELGAVPDLEIGKWSWTYADLARAMGKPTLAGELEDRVLEEADEASDDDSTCTMAF